MAGTISMAARAEVTAAIRERYLASGKTAKGAILDEFVAVTGLHRKHAIRLLSAKNASRRLRGRPKARYGRAVAEALVLLWEASDRVCSKRLKPMIPVLLPALERHGQIVVDEELRAALLSVSPATIDRLLSELRIAAAQGRRRRAGFSSAVRRSVPVRTFADWGDPPPGFVEVDFVAHSGPSATGAFVQTMVLTDIATGWTECVPVVMRAGALALEALQIAEGLFPFPLKGVDFDNDGAFMNAPVVDWCRARGLEVTRSRAYRKNDQAWVEQKNGAIVRRLVGYGRFEGAASAAALVRLYAAARLHVNLFQPSFKLRERTRIGARVTKRWHAPATPADRTLASGRLDAASARRIEDLRSRADPVIALAAIRAAQAELGGRVDQRGTGPVEANAPIVIDIAAALEDAARRGEQRPIHCRPYRRVKPIPKRPSMLDAHRCEIDLWLDAEPEITAVEVLARLRARHPDRFTEKHLRTVQRMVRAWRADQATRLIRSGTAALEAAMATAAPTPAW
ncbi:ISNCY family transposase [uncultured Amaricoccus sp.]|uniref:ISNCY family transposase n=1 Tax=uncultured Amaricoccus sp. TaxID=339341 RepID=UPI002625CF8A|nr:ISNCY family transposase [uncultured Amaricoccus sp.]